MQPCCKCLCYMGIVLEAECHSNILNPSMGNTTRGQKVVVVQSYLRQIIDEDFSFQTNA